MSRLRKTGLTSGSLPHASTSKILQVRHSNLTTDFSTTAVDPVFATVLTDSITLAAGSKLIIDFSIVGGLVAGTVFTSMRVTVDGTPIIGSGDGFIGGFFLGGHSTAEVTGLSAGPHTVDLELAKIPGSPGATAITVLAATTPLLQLAQLTLKEVGA